MNELAKYFDNNRKLSAEEQGLMNLLLMAYENANTYGKDFNPVTRVNAWMLASQGKYSIEDMCYAIMEHMRTQDTMPTVSIVSDYVDGGEIKESEFIAAQNAKKHLQKTGEWNHFQPEAITIKKYKEQEGEKQNPQNISRKMAKRLMKQVNGKLKKIEG